MSQRIESFAIDVSENGSFRNVFSETTVRYKRIVPLCSIETDCVRIRITDSRIQPIISFIGIFKAVGTPD